MDELDTEDRLHLCGQLLEMLAELLAPLPPNASGSAIRAQGDAFRAAVKHAPSTPGVYTLHGGPTGPPLATIWLEAERWRYAIGDQRRRLGAVTRGRSGRPIESANPTAVADMLRWLHQNGRAAGIAARMRATATPFRGHEYVVVARLAGGRLVLDPAATFEQVP